MPNFVSGRLSKSTRNNRRAGPKRTSNRRMDWSLYDDRGRRKYLVPLERRRFLRAALGARGKVATFCAVLTLSGGRVSEVLSLTPDRIDVANSTVNFKTLKQRGKVRTRAVPIPRELIYYLDLVHKIEEARRDPLRARERLWPWTRLTAWRYVVKVMKLARNPEFLANPKSLRHAFGVEATLEGVSLTMIQKWMGHADLRTTTIYTQVTGREERRLARRTWRGLSRVFREPVSSKRT